MKSILSNKKNKSDFRRKSQIRVTMKGIYRRGSYVKI